MCLSLGTFPHRPRLPDTAFLIFCHLPRRSPLLFQPELVGLDPVLSSPHPHPRTPRQPLAALTSPPSPSRANRAGPTARQQFLALNGSLILIPHHPTLPQNPELVWHQWHRSGVPSAGSRRQHCLFFTNSLFSLSPLCCADVSVFSRALPAGGREKPRSH